MKKLFIVFYLLSCFYCIYAQKANLSVNDILKTKFNTQSNSAKSNWVGGDCTANTYWTGAQATGGSEIFIKGDQFLTIGQQIEKVRFYHHKGNMTFTNGNTINFNCTSYTIEIYQNPNLALNYYSNVLFSPLYHGAIPVYTQTFDLTNAQNGVYEATLNTPYTYNGSTPFLVGVKFDNGKGICAIDSVYNTSIAGGLFYRLVPITFFNSDPNIVADAIGNCLYDEGNNDNNGYYYRLGIELCTDSSDPICDIETILMNASNSTFGDNDTIIAGNSNFQFKIAAFNNGPDYANGTFTYSCNADGNHNLLSTPTGTTTIAIPSQNGSFLGNLNTLTEANMNSWGLINFDITTNITFASTTGGTLTDPQANNTVVYNIQRTIQQPTLQTYTPLQNSTNVAINSPIELVFDINIVANPVVLSGITITGNQSVGTITYQILSNTLKIYHSSPLIYGEQYTVHVPANSFLHSNSTMIQTPAYIWTFNTLNAPNCATMLIPTNGQSNVATNIQLMWNSAANATSYDLYLGTTANPTLVTNVTTTNYTTTLISGTTYFWKIVPKNDAGYAQNCDVWTFSTIPSTLIPDCATAVYPPIGTNNVLTNAVLSWSPVANATTYDVYFGTAGNMVFVINTAATSYTPTLIANTSYLWKIVPKNGTEIAIDCETWSFTTDNSTNISSTNINNPINIYPNPSNGSVNFVTNEKSIVSMYDITGKLIRTLSLNPHELKTIQEKSGIYIIQIKTNNSTTIKKLIIK